MMREVFRLATDSAGAPVPGAHPDAVLGVKETVRPTTTRAGAAAAARSATAGKPGASRKGAAWATVADPDGAHLGKCPDVDFSSHVSPSLVK